jgi:hypothetical protein
MYSSRRVKDLLIISKEEHRPLRGNRVRSQVFFKYVPVASFYEKDLASQKIAAIELVESGLASIKDAGEVVGLHRNTISESIKIKQLLGISSAIKDDRGRKGPIHYTPDIRAHIVKLVENYPGWTDTQIAKQAAKDLKTRVSRQAVARIRVSHFEPANSLSPPSKSELIEIEGMARRMEEQVRQYVQRSFDFENSPELKDKVQEFADEPTPKATGDSEVKALSQLQQGVATPYAGLLFYHLFLSELNFCELCKEFKLGENGEYQASEIFLSLVFGLALRLPSIEAHKLVNASQFGPLFGMPRSPDLITIRSCLEVMAEQDLADSVIDKFALQVLKIGAVDPEVFFIDGHFLPYYGLSLLAKGYHTVRRQVLKGNEIYVVSDLNKRPLMFITQGCEIDFRPTIEKIADRIIGYGVNRPLLVFDRGGYGIHFFSRLSVKADFITWGKYIRNEELSSIADEQFTVGFRFGDKCYEISEVDKEVVESADTAKKEGREQRTRIKVRMVVIRTINEKTREQVGKRLSIFTCNKDRQSWEIAYFMLNRWGKSENFFKEIMAIFSFNYHPGYAINEMEEQPLFDNPKAGIICSAIKSLEKEIRILEGEIAISKLEYQDNSKKRTAGKIERLEAKKQEKMQDKEGLEKQLEKLPDKVTLESLLDRPMSQCDLEKKRLYDLMQVIAYHARERLVDEFRHSYNRQQDVKQILDKTTNKGGYVRLIGNTLVVLLDWIERPSHREAAESLCQRVNSLGITMQGRLSPRLHFAMAQSPLIGV